MSALRQRVDACIGPARTMDPHRSAGYLAERRFQVILNGFAIGLALPSGKRSTVVRDDQLESGRHLLGRLIIAMRPEARRDIPAG